MFGETLSGGCDLQPGKGVRGIQFRHQSASLADQKCCGQAVMSMRASDKRIAALDLVDQSMREKAVAGRMPYG